MTGSLLAACCAVSYSLVAIFVRKGSRPDDACNGVLIGLLANLVLLGTAYLLKISVFGEPVPPTRTGLWFFAAAGFTSAWLAREALHRGIRHIGPGRTAAIKNLNPFVAVALGVALLGDRFTGMAMLGAAIALTGYALIVLEPTRDSRAPPQPATPDRSSVDRPSIADTGVVTGARTRWSRVVTRRSLGYGIASMAAIAFGTGQVFRGAGIDRIPDAYLGAWVAAIVGTAAFSLFGLARGNLGRELRTTFSEPHTYFWLAGAASAVGNLCFFLALGQASVSHVSIIAASDTVLTVILAAILFRTTEGVSRMLVVAALAVFGGSVLLAVG